MSEELIFIPFSTFTHAQKISHAAFLMCIICRIRPGDTNLIAAIGNGDEISNNDAIKFWLESRLTALVEEEHLVKQVEKLSEKLLDQLHQFQHTHY